MTSSSKNRFSPSKKRALASRLTSSGHSITAGDDSEEETSSLFDMEDLVPSRFTKGSNPHMQTSKGNAFMEHEGHKSGITELTVEEDALTEVYARKKPSHSGDNDSTGNMSYTEDHEDENESISPRKKLNFIRDFRDFCGLVVNDNRVQILIVVLICINAIMMGLGTFDFVTDNEDVLVAFDTIDKIFLIVFTVEAALQLIFNGLFDVLTDPWLCFDLIIVVASWSLESLQVVRAFRVFRAVRLVTRLKTLKQLVQALLNVAPSVGAILGLLVLFMYIYAVMCTELFGDLFERGITDTDYFGRLDTTMFTLFQMVTLDWAGIVRQVAAEHFYAWTLFSTFLVITSFILYSLVVAVVCDAVSEQKHEGEIDPMETSERVDQLRRKVRHLSTQQEHLLMLLKNCTSHLDESNQSFDGTDVDSALSPSSSTISSLGAMREENWTGSLVPQATSTVNFDLTITRKVKDRSKRGFL